MARAPKQYTFRIATTDEVTQAVEAHSRRDWQDLLFRGETLHMDSAPRAGAAIKGRLASAGKRIVSIPSADGQGVIVWLEDVTP